MFRSRDCSACHDCRPRLCPVPIAAAGVRCCLRLPRLVDRPALTMPSSSWRTLTMEEAGVMQRVSPERSSLAVATTGAPKLLDRVRQTIRAKHYSRRTESAYVDWIRRYILFHRKRHPSEMGATEVSAFLTWLATSRRVSASTQNQALSAVLFLSRCPTHRDRPCRTRPARSDAGSCTGGAEP